VLYPRVGKPDLAVASAELATREYSNSFRAWNRLGEARELTGDAAGARAAYQRSNELRPGNLLASRYLASHP
jgi:cytochrome c-type biogenesis protein CcmH/NrfG